MAGKENVRGFAMLSVLLGCFVRNQSAEKIRRKKEDDG
jgi:hypothetical protein